MTKIKELLSDTRNAILAITTILGFLGTISAGIFWVDDRYAKAEEVLIPQVSFIEGIEEEIKTYERLKNGDLGAIPIQEGKKLIGLRILAKLTPETLAQILKTTPEQVRKDEKNEYYGASEERKLKTMKVLLWSSNIQKVGDDL